MIEYIEGVNDFVITEFYNIPFQELFRFNKMWCVKVHVDCYVNAKFWPDNLVKFSIPIDALVAAPTCSIPKNKLNCLGNDWYP